MKAYTRKGAIKIAVTDPLGQQSVEDSISVTMARNSAATTPEDEALELLRKINDAAQLMVAILTKARL